MMVISELHHSALAAPVSRRICNKLTTALAYPKLEVCKNLVDIAIDMISLISSFVRSSLLA